MQPPCPEKITCRMASALEPMPHRREVKNRRGIVVQHIVSDIFGNWFVRSFVRWLVRSFIHAAFVCLFVYSFIHLFIQSFVDLFIDFVLHFFVYSCLSLILFVYMFIHVVVLNLFICFPRDAFFLSDQCVMGISLTHTLAHRPPKPKPPAGLFSGLARASVTGALLEGGGGGGGWKLRRPVPTQ